MTATARAGYAEFGTSASGHVRDAQQAEEQQQQCGGEAEEQRSTLSRVG